MYYIVGLENEASVAQWLMMLINGGQYPGKAFLNPETVASMWEGHALCMEIMPGSEYGLAGPSLQTTG